MSVDAATNEGAVAVVQAYHELSKHQLTRYAPGPETLDWESRPAVFRHFTDSEVLALPRVAQAGAELATALARPLSELAAAAPLPFDLSSLGALFELSLGITAWKSQGPDRWALRANPSSGNLHPVEGYALVTGSAALEAGVYHYRAEDHVLERRARWQAESGPVARVWIALTSIMWREAWKYGERGFRYCQLDTGHARAALGYAAAVLGWRMREEPQIGWETLRHALGLDRPDDFARAKRPETEHEEPELLVELECGAARAPLEPAELRERAASATFSGRGNSIDPHPMYSWPGLQAVAAATRWNDGPPEPALAAPPALAPAPGGAPRTQPAAAQLILMRRSAQRFDRQFVLPRSVFADLLGSLVPGAGCAPAAVAEPSSLDLVLFVHRVESLAPGVYLLPRTSEAERSLAAWWRPRFALQPVMGVGNSPGLLELATLAAGDLARIARQLHCHQDIARDCCFAVAMLSDFEPATRSAPAYRRLLREAGSLGQTLYLQAEAAQLRGTGIGCFFDDAVAELLGLSGTPLRSLYHFSVGKPIDDARIETSWTAQLSPAREAGT